MHTHAFAKSLESLHLLNHPFYIDWMAGRLSKSQLQDYAGQYFSHVEAFPRYLSSIHSLMENADDRKIILENLNDEEGKGFCESHPELWLQFAQGLGLSKKETVDAPKRQAIKDVVNTFFRLSRASAHQGLGALYAYEHQVPEIAASKIDGLRENYGITEENTVKFFEVHKNADTLHRQAIEKIIDRLPEAERHEAQAAAQEAANSLWHFLSDVHGNA